MSSVATPTYPRRAGRNLGVLLVGNVVLHGTMFLVKPVVSYRVLALGGDETSVGLVVAAGALIPVFLAIPLGRLCDRGHTPWVLLGGLAALAVAPLGLAQVHSLPALAAVNAGHGTGLLAAMVGSQALVSGMSTPSSRDRDFGWFTAAASLGQLLGPLTAGWVMSATSPKELLPATTYAFSTATAVAAAALVLFAGLLAVLRGSAAVAPSGRRGERPGRGSALKLLADRQLAVALLVSGSVIATVDLLTAYLPVLGDEHGLSPAFVGALLAVRAAASFLSRVFIGWLMARAGRLTVVLASSALAAVGMLALVPVEQPVLLVVLMTVLGLALGLGQPLTMTWVIELAPQQLRATALAVRVTGNRVAQSAVPAVAGGLSSAAGAAAPFALGAALLALAAGCVVPFVRTSKYLADR